MSNGGRPLFPGSDVDDQLRKIYKILGSPSEDSWPGLTKLPDYKDYGYSSSVSLSLVVPKLPTVGKDLLQNLLICNPSMRMAADVAMNHQYFNDLSPSIKN